MTIDTSVIEELNDRYVRVSGNVDFNEMTSTTLVVVGTGASGQMIEGFVRLGIKRLYLFDLDTVEAKNLAAQNFTCDDIGLPKTEALKRRLEACEFERDNSAVPALEVVTGGDFLAISDDDIDELIRGEKAAGNRVLFIMASDHHPVQARGSRIALWYDVTVFWVGIYRGGMAGEIIFFDREHPLPCYRCITRERYEYWDANHLVDHRSGTTKTGAGRSAGLPMAASFIDAILGHLVIGAIHKVIPDNPHGAFYRRLLAEKRNFIQTQLDPTYRLGDEDLFAQIEGKDIISFNTLFQTEAHKADCPDCATVEQNWGGHFGMVAVLPWKRTDYTNTIPVSPHLDGQAPLASAPLAVPPFVYRGA
ncbi:ThiF family adenylyltransferase [Rhodospirillum sp. A1_3_36]|uniref:ThiF family adenylyltransferase n=1 Tax=Rhodospirillum sp. A1_3_36 TaxID=3391666 RepID=UPI0039A74DEC